MSLQTILKYLRQADNEYQLIEAQDRIGVGLSGGKDSIVLLHALKRYQSFSPVPFELFAFHIQVGFEQDDFHLLKEYCDKNAIEYIHVDTDIYASLSSHMTNKNQLPCSLCSKMKRATIFRCAKEHNCNKIAYGHHLDDAIETIFLNMIKNQLPCSLCSKMKRATIFRCAKEHNCNKIAYGHHLDDAIETIFLNMIYGGKIATFTPKTMFERAGMELIRPLIYASEDEIAKVIQKENLPVIISNCPNDKKTQREDIKSWLNQVYRDFPTSRKNFIKMLENGEQLKIWK